MSRVCMCACADAQKITSLFVPPFLLQQNMTSGDVTNENKDQWQLALEFGAVSVRDSGLYHCRASNQFEEVEATVDLQVYAFPSG